MKKTMRIRVLAIAAATTLTVGMFTGFTSSAINKVSAKAAPLTKVTLQLKWLEQSQFMGYYVAQQKGYYKQQGLDVTIIPGGSDIIPEQQVSNGVANIGVTWTSSLMKYQEKGFKLKEIAQVFQKSAMLLVSKKKTGVKSVKDLKGKKIASWFGGNEYELYALLDKNKIDKSKDVTLVQQDFTMNQLESGKVDVAQAMTYNEYGLLLEAGYKPSALNTIDVNKEGVAMLEDCLFVNPDWASKNKTTVVKFLKASIQGWAAACKDPTAAGTYVYKANKSVSLHHQIYMAQKIAELVKTPGITDKTIGKIDMKAIKQTATLGLKYGLLTKAADTSKTVDTSYWTAATK